MGYVIEWRGAHPSNWMAGREHEPVVGFMEHWIGEGTLDGAADYFAHQHPTPPGPTSAHFIVGGDGRIVQCVGELDTAFAAGDWMTNLRTISIEHELTPGLPATDALYAASGWLHHHVAKQFGITLALGTTMWPHNAIVATDCPGTLDLARIIREAQEDDMTDAQLKEIVDKLNGVAATFQDALHRFQTNHDVLTGDPLVAPNDALHVRQV